MEFKTIILAIAGFVIGIFAVIGVTNTISGNGQNGIHVISENAVYIAGESCVINAGLDRANDDILSEARDCAELHGAYRTLRHFDEKNAKELAIVAD
ncbi:MAG: hypothetical protein CME17_06410 [Gemmatimonadetes bacterium]|nr:hypothetical protein [Gemmatimonadota bacterium]|tara:strand:+ start:2186 stop:2476 length:291 start_codon:yes stop_codon:yes gene_type:complete